MGQIVLKSAGQLSRLLIGLAERNAVVKVSDADGAVLTEPVLLIGSKVYVGICFIIILNLIFNANFNI